MNTSQKNYVDFIRGCVNRPSVTIYQKCSTKQTDPYYYDRFHCQHIARISTAPSFVAGIKAVGPMLFVVGAITTLIPLCFGLFIGHKIFKFNPAITLGCCCGTRTCTAALGAVQTTLGSTLPAIGYTVTYAVSNILLIVWGLLTVMLV